MFEEQEELEINPEDVTEEDLLLYSTFPGPRIFIMNDLDKTNVLGVLLEESDDSFLVGLPARMFPDKDKLLVEPFMPVPYTRFLKSAIMNVSYTYGAIERAYVEYVGKKGQEIYPEIFEYIEEGTEVDVEPTEIMASTIMDEDIGLAKDAAEGQQVFGMTDDELMEHLNEKYNKGELVSGSRKKH